MLLDESLVGREFGPTAPFPVTAAGVEAFIASTGAAVSLTPQGAPKVPATYPIVVLFSAMNTFLDAAEVDLSRIIHGEQRFGYERPVAVGDTLTATLTVHSVRQMAGNTVIGTRSTVVDERGAAVCTARATLVHTAGEEAA